MERGKALARGVGYEILASVVKFCHLVHNHRLQGGMEISDEGHLTLNLPPQVTAFYAFRVYFKDRRILFQLGESNNMMSALPGDPRFAQKDNH